MAAAAVAALVGAVLGALVPSLVGRIPEPAEDPHPEDGPKVPYAVLAARPGLAMRTAVVSGVASGLLGYAVGWERALVGLLPLVPVCVALGLVDLRTRLLPRVVVLPATAGLVVLAVVEALATGDRDDLVRAAIGLVVARSCYWLLWFVHSAGMGFGDVRLAALLGFALAYLGWAEFALGVYAGFLVFALPGLLLAIVRRDRSLLRSPYPFGPAMIVGALLGVVLGPTLLSGLALA
ncbi:A24 family peptidase [Nocardioides sp. W7]|uniref:prepilin peptidase n=1 Tax=Nocardioides sp. W7 TaxID=2931390 RepID=UPI001FCFD3BB|nr:A24 family peptidase [Nocardioides sp. W7]